MAEIELRRTLGISYRAVRNCLLFEPESVFGTGPYQPKASLSGKLADVEVAVTVDVSVGDFTESREPAACSRNVHIEAEGHAGWFPRLDATLEATEQRGSTEMVLRGSYRPPGGAVGRAVDAVTLHRVAETSMSRYFTQVLDRLRRKGSGHDALSGVPT